LTGATRYLTLTGFLDLAVIALGQPATIRDPGLLASALHRPAVTVFGADAYPTTLHKAAALVQSLACNHALVDGNKRCAFIALAVFCEKNGYPLTFTSAQATTFMVQVASGQLTDVEQIVAVLDANTTASGPYARKVITWSAISGEDSAEDPIHVKLPEFSDNVEIMGIVIYDGDAEDPENMAQ
jgi:death-on-curing protein